jgi:hypothetical protein
MTAIPLDARGRRLRAALAAVLVTDNPPELRLVRHWLDSWSGLGLIIAGMTHQGWDVQLTAYAAARLAGRTSSRSASPTPSSAEGPPPLCLALLRAEVLDEPVARATAR